MERIEVEKYIKNERFIFTGSRYVTGKLVLASIGELVTDRDGNKGRLVRALICSKRVKNVDLLKTNMEAMTYFVYRDIGGFTKEYQCGMFSDFECKGITERAKEWLLEYDTNMIEG